MFYNIIKNFFLKKNVTKRLATKNLLSSNDKVVTVGILVDESYFTGTNQLIESIISQGIEAGKISVLVYKDKIKKKEVINEPFLSLKNISLSGEINKKEVNEFIETPFDLLVNYYDVNKSALLLLSTKSKAKFKVGFDTVDKRVNHVIIKSLVENFNEFVLELFKYLKILNKI
ncbi:hypothetical protein GFJ94_01275 [Flavobacterium sp. LMO8]|uniref:DUF6913 domain-containing protein n=1 Tax=Flavobacterium sp. LMO8 TaxID=2654244 RepID=UPI001291B488|nr:hypothetical protein [Flavobacterium sp. LMO8]MQP23690.1 hypothetical protein [Flavobacterium sp. LMO8]